MTRTRFGSVALAVPFLLGGTLLAACGGESPDPAPTSASPTVEESTTPSEPSPSEDPSESPSTTPAPLPAGPLATRLIEPGELPGLNDEWSWREVSTKPTGPEEFGQCAKFDVLSIGATESITRTYAEEGGTTSGAGAAMQLVEFPDTKTAQRATKVLESWHDSCARRIKPSLSTKVSALQDVPVSADSGSWYLVITSKPKADEGHFHAFGMTVSGSRMALLTMDTEGQDRNYEPGEDPMELAVAMAADRIR